MEGKRKIIVRLAKMLTDDVDIKLGKVPVDEKRPEYWMLDLLLDDEMAEMVLKMGRRKPITFEKLVKKMKWDSDHTRAVLDRLTDVGVVEFNRHNDKKELQYVVPVFVVGMAENLMMNKKLIEKYPMEMARFQDEMAYLPMVGLTAMIPPGGAGTGFHVIPVEKAIAKESQALDIEHISHWLDKYEGHYVTMPCVCRRSMRIQGKGCGELEDGVCVGLGDYADYLLETDKEVKPIARKDLEELLETLEENGYMHQITNGDGRDDIFAICNCTVGSCFGLRCSQLFNQPNSSASAYRAEVTTENCVACGKCVEACPASAPRLGQKLCTLSGPVKYPKQPLPDETPDWGPKYWNVNFREDNQINCYDTGTAPCKTACPAHIAIQGYIQLAKEGRYQEALELIKLDNPFPAVCGSVCNKRCEAACTRGLVDDPLSIDEIKKFIVYQELDAEKRYIPKKLRHWGKDEDHTQKIAVIGAGPGGMTCAYFLANMGYPVTVFDRAQRPGGMLVNGLPNFRLEKDILNAEIDVLREMGVEFKCGADVARTAVRSGAESVDLFCLEDYATMPMGPEDQKECQEDGIVIHDGWGQTEIITENGQCRGIKFRKCLSVKNAEGRFDPKFDDDQTVTAGCTTVLSCIGQRPDWGKLLEGTKVELSPRGFVVADPLTRQTAEPDIFVGGDKTVGKILEHGIKRKIKLTVKGMTQHA